MQKITDNVYVETGFGGSNNTFVVTSEGVVIIDTPQDPADAMKWNAEIAKHGKVKYILNTEPHGDHVSGNFFFEGTVIAHDGVREAVKASSLEQYKEQMKDASLPEDFCFKPPDITFSEELTLHFGDHSFRMVHLPGHSPYQAAVYIPEEKVVCTSDNVVYKVQPFLHQSMPYEWLESLKKYREFDADYVVPGHGDVCGIEYIPEMSKTIQAWIDAAKDAIQNGMTAGEVSEATEMLKKHGINVGDNAFAKRVIGMSMTRLLEVLKD
ncbi:MAG: MBL fold metallo-hydrolase [Dehalococcoidales bacterium]|nr:MBL fold metallo-hydrolase [Dehalococcoidales bacterium]